MTIKQLAFRSWQESRGASSLEESGPSWERFNNWWLASYGYIGADDLSIDEITLWQGNETCEISARAWNEAQRERFNAWWSAVASSTENKS